MRKSMFLVIPVALMAFFAVSAVPVAAQTSPGAGESVTNVSPSLNGNLSNPGFPCGNADDVALDAFSRYLGIGAPKTYACNGTIYANALMPNAASFVGTGTTSTLQPYTIAGPLGTIGGAYTYSEPCQSGVAATGEARGSLTMALPIATGHVGTTIVNTARVTVNFWWSRVGLTALVGIKGVTVTVNNSLTFTDPSAAGVALAAFVPVNQPACGHPVHPAAGDINIVSGTITTGSAI